MSERSVLLVLKGNVSIDTSELFLQLININDGDQEVKKSTP